MNSTALRMIFTMASTGLVLMAVFVVIGGEPISAVTYVITCIMGAFAFAGLERYEYDEQNLRHYIHEHTIPLGDHTGLPTSDRDHTSAEDDY